MVSTRQGNRYNFRVENYQGTKYKRSPCFKGSTLWDELPLNVINIPILREFKAKIRDLFSPFDETLT